MYRLWTVTFVTICFGMAVASAQDNPFSADARQTYALIKDSILRAADKMPAQDYSLRSTPPVRSFAEMMRSLKMTLTVANATQPRKIRVSPARVACSEGPNVKNCTRPSLRI